MPYWTILDGSTVTAANVPSDTMPDPANYGGDTAVDQGGLKDSACYDWDGTEWVLNLPPIKAARIKQVNDRADATALQFITPGARQAMTYLRKETEARAWTQGADPEDFPFITAEAASTGVTVETLVADIIASADLWASIGAAIEANRRALIVSIDACLTLEDLNQINIEAGWPS